MSEYDGRPDFKVGDLVRRRSTRLRHKGRHLWIVIKVKPEKTCKVNPMQHVRATRVDDNKTTLFTDKRLEWVK